MALFSPTLHTYSKMDEMGIGDARRRQTSFFCQGSDVAWSEGCCVRVVGLKEWTRKLVDSLHISSSAHTHTESPLLRMNLRKVIAKMLSTLGTGAKLSERYLFQVLYI